MTPDRLERLLREVPVPAAPGARERTVEAARGAVARRPTARRGRRTIAIASAAALLAGALLTPPGRAASGWVGELVGIGEVGGSPTQKHRSFGDSGQAIVINNGTAPDGSRYEWVAYPCKVDLREEGLPTRFEGFGLSLEWPGVKDPSGGSGGGSCEERGGRTGPEREQLLESFGVHIMPSQFKGVEAPDLVVSGATGAAVHEVRVVYTDALGARHDLPVDFEPIGPRLRDVVTASESLGGSFVAFVPGEWAARDEVESRLDLRALAGTGKLEAGPITRRDRRAARRAHELCAPKHPRPDELTDPGDDEALRRAFAPYRACLETHMPPSPVEIIGYDERGRELGRQQYPMVLSVRRLPPPLPADVRTRRPHDPDADGKPVVLTTGRAPGGARYEVFVEKFAEPDGRVYGRCLTTWWPGAAGPGGSGSCGPSLPPSTAFGRRHPERVAAKPFGFLADARPASQSLMLSGFARAMVDRVRVVYGEGGQALDAPVELTHVTGKLVERMAADGPFGYFVAFMPRSARGEPIEVIAYDDGGRELSRVTHREPGD